ncbi:MAG: type I pullulanase [Tissierellia bacterium]|nr:type I pullulanase [Tissierellia bacterium]
MNEDKLLDLKFGAIYSVGETTFRVYSPPTTEMHLRIYREYNDIIYDQYEMGKSELGYFESTVKGDLDGYFYTYLVDGVSEVTDPYSIASSVNSLKSAVVDLEKSNPDNWMNHNRPILRKEDAIIYELHIKDYTFSENSGVENRGKYLGLAESGTKYLNFSTGIDHLKEMGITHVHLLPVYDFLTVKEETSSFYDVNNYNWGYDPELFNVPEGSYSTVPTNPYSRIKELKTLIMKLHENGIGVVLDFVYNHSYRGGTSNFETLYPNYYYRMYNGNFSNGAGVGNEFDTQKPMYRKFILDSIKYWLEEYKIDGMRFDLMGLMDIDTMDEIVSMSKSINKNVIIYGEPWAADLTTLPREKMIVKGMQKGKDFAVFNDTFRDCIKGNHNSMLKGFAMGNGNNKICVETGILGSFNYDNYHVGFTDNPLESINYVNSHDDLILYDEISLSMKNASEEEKKGVNRVALGILLTSFGTPFIHEGNEFLRSKGLNNNTYNMPITINQVDWSLKEKNYEEYICFKDLIEFRKKSKIFELNDKEQIKARVKFLDFKTNPIIGYMIKKSEKGYYLIVHNASNQNYRYNIDRIKEFIANSYGVNLYKTRMKSINLFNKKGLNRHNKLAHKTHIYLEKQATQIFYFSLDHGMSRFNK